MDEIPLAPHRDGRPRKMSSKYGVYRRNSLGGSPAVAQKGSPAAVRIPTDDDEDHAKASDEGVSRPCSPTSDPEDSHAMPEDRSAPSTAQNNAATAADVATPSAARLSPSEQAPGVQGESSGESALLAARRGDISPAEAAARLYA